MSHRKFKVQKRVRITAHDKSGRKFLLSEAWHTVVGADHLRDAQAAISVQRAERPQKEFRLIEQMARGRVRIIDDWRNAPGEMKVGKTAPLDYKSLGTG